MKTGIKRLLSCIILLAMIVCAVRFLGHFLDPEGSYDGFQVINAFHSLEENSLDVIVYGSSHAWLGVDTRVLRERCGISAYNYGCNWQSMNTILLFLQDSLTTQTPKVVCIETGYVDLTPRNRAMDGQIYYASGIPFSKEKVDYFLHVFGTKPDGVHFERYLSYFFPLIMFHDNWNIISRENYIGDVNPSWVASAGFCPVDSVYEGTIPDYRSFRQEELSDSSTAFLDQMVRECHERGIDVIFFTCPYEGEYCFGEAMERYARENGCAYLDFFEKAQEVGIDEKTDLCDDGHLNVAGAGKVADYIGAYIRANYPDL